jgi:hypothetical protein
MRSKEGDGPIIANHIKIMETQLPMNWGNWIDENKYSFDF